MQFRKMQIFEMTNVENSAFYVGYRAFLKGSPNTDNPHVLQTATHYQWAKGWHSAREDFIEDTVKNKEKPFEDRA